MKKTFVGITILFSAAIIGGAVLQNAKAQDGQNCQSAAEAAGKACESTSFKCYDSCKPIKDSSFYGCQDACYKKSRDCYQARNDAYDACLGGVAVPDASNDNKIVPENSKAITGDGRSEKTEALVDTTPRDDDIQLKTYFGKEMPPVDEQGRLQFVVRELDGTADAQLSDGTWVEVHEGSIIPYGATIFTGYASKAVLEGSFYRGMILTMRSLSELNVEQFVKDASVYRKELKLETGELRFKVEPSGLPEDLESFLKVTTPNTTASIAGTDFGASYDKNTGQSFWEIYDGSIEVTSNLTGEKRAISSSYGSPIRRIEVARDGAMIEKIAVPKSEWSGVQTTKDGIWIWVLATALMGGIGYFAYRKKRHNS